MKITIYTYRLKRCWDKLSFPIGIHYYKHMNMLEISLYFWNIVIYKGRDGENNGK